MDKKKDQGQFSLLPANESKSTFQSICKKESLITIWKKGSSTKFNFIAEGFNKDQMMIQLRPQSSNIPSSLLEETLLANSSLETLQYFFSGKLSFDKMNNVYSFSISENVYKFERRKNFRLSTALKHNAKIILRLPDSFSPPANVFKLDSRGEQTKLFKAFLEMLNEVNQGDEKFFKVSLKVLDISTSGLAFIVGELEKKYLFESDVFYNSFLEFNETNYVIPKIKLVYVMNFIDPNKPGTRLFKVGLQFLDLPIEIDNAISMQISKELRESDVNRVFEEFLK
jgi:hypothetical protein